MSTVPRGPLAQSLDAHVQQPRVQDQSAFLALVGKSMMTYFVSGHLDLTMDEFREHYVPRLEVAVREEAAFVVGDARGCDRMTQMYLKDAHALRVQVFHMFEAPRHNANGFPTVGGFQTDSARDEAMTNHSNADIAWVRPGRKNSGTAANLARRYFKADARETIIRAAIFYEGTIYSVPPPGRHHTVIQMMARDGFPDEAMRLQNQGFVTSTGRFVDRYEAARIARAAGQIIREPTPSDMLTSEDVW
jgi:hypothetical protein